MLNKSPTIRKSNISFKFSSLFCFSQRGKSNNKNAFWFHPTFKFSRCPGTAKKTFLLSDPNFVHDLVQVSLTSTSPCACVCVCLSVCLRAFWILHWCNIVQGILSRPELTAYDSQSIRLSAGFDASSLHE